MVPDRVAVDGGRDPLGPGLGQRTRQRLVAGASRPGVEHGQFLEPVGLPQSLREAYRSIGLSGPEHVRKVLRVGGISQADDAEVGMEHVAALNDVPAFRSGRS